MGNRRRGRGVEGLLLVALQLLLIPLVVIQVGAEVPSRGYLLVKPGEDATPPLAVVTTLANVTKVEISGFIGAPTSYSDLLRVCNIGEEDLAIAFKVADADDPQQRLRVFKAYLSNDADDPRKVLLLSPPSIVESEPIELEPGGCGVVSVEILVSAEARAGELPTLRIYLTSYP